MGKKHFHHKTRNLSHKKSKKYIDEESNPSIDVNDIDDFNTADHNDYDNNHDIAEEHSEEHSEEHNEKHNERHREHSNRNSKIKTRTKSIKAKKSKIKHKKIINEHSDNEIRPKRIELAEKTKKHLKRKINDWLDCDDKIKILNAKVKKYKDEKKQQEEFIIKVITKLGMDETKIDVHDENKQIRSRVYKHKSTTKGALKEDIVKDALMEVIRDEKKVDQLIKKIDSKRPINERYYLKRTKGLKNE